MQEVIYFITKLIMFVIIIILYYNFKALITKYYYRYLIERTYLNFNSDVVFIVFPSLKFLFLID